MPNRIDIRNMLAQRMGDLTEVTVDLPAIGTMSYTTISSYRLTALDDDYYRDVDAVFDYQQGTYDRRRVLSYVPSLSGLTGGLIRVDSTLSLLPSTNTEVFIYRDYRANHYDRALNAGIRRAAESRLVEVARVDSTLVATTDTWEYAVPTSSGIKRVMDVYWLNDTNDDEPLMLSERNWYTRRNGGVTTIVFRREEQVQSGKTIRVHGTGEPDELDADGDVLLEEVPVEYLLQYASAEMLESRWAATDPDNAAQRATYLRQVAEAGLRSARRYSGRGRLIRRWRE